VEREGTETGSLGWLLRGAAAGAILAGIIGVVALAPGRAAPEAAALTLKLQPPLPPPPLPEVTGPAGRPLVVIDPGHGGHDPGALSRSGAVSEKAVTLALARAVRARLMAGGRVRVALTRDADRYLSLRERFETARQLGAALFISLHADAAPLNDDAHGATIYTLSEVASDREAAALARSENRADIVRGINLSGTDGTVASILIDLAQRESRDTAVAFARLLHREAAGSVPFRPDHHRTASLIVLKAPDLPSVLLEAGYITNDTDLAFIDSAAGRARIAEALARAVEIHFAKRLAAP